MKFEKTNSNEPEKMPVAYLTTMGSLVIWSEYRCSGVWIDSTDGETDNNWDFDPSEAKEVFYPGDQLTITF